MPENIKHLKIYVNCVNTHQYNFMSIPLSSSQVFKAGRLTDSRKAGMAKLLDAILQFLFSYAPNRTEMLDGPNPECHPSM